MSDGHFLLRRIGILAVVVTLAVLSSCDIGLPLDDPRGVNCLVRVVPSTPSLVLRVDGTAQLVVGRSGTGGCPVSNSKVVFAVTVGGDVVGMSLLNDSTALITPRRVGIASVTATLGQDTRRGDVVFINSLSFELTVTQ
jgi:hypothetical protein